MSVTDEEEAFKLGADRYWNLHSNNIMKITEL